ncbi:DEAD/DEAH box helicase [Shouchella shacheensis]|uniref:DEAD/DEAH box helicase n=1 Tax=Shouchella shacheensis TaxID=1649580 RepID=UPI00073FD4C8|nr:DEAD/DEAH box helicase [Shouchella shacheensis]
MTAENFKRFGLNNRLIEALSQEGLSQPTQIQERLIPAILNRRDVIGQSQTGTGKTFAFLLPMVENLELETQELQAIVTAPTRELATQLFEELKKLLAFYEGGVDARLLVGGTDRMRFSEKLKKKQPHIVIGTPGRIQDLIGDSSLLVHTATSYVVDEADQMLDMGFIEDVDRIASAMNGKLQMLVFSATIPEKLQPFLKKYMNNPRHVHIQPEKQAAEKITHQLVPVRHREKLPLLTEIAKHVNPYLALVFANTKERADELADTLAAAGLNVDRLHGGLAPRERKKVMKRVHDGGVQYLVATDLAARGIDIEGVSHIINYEFPSDLDFYIHRVGRTARAGADGLAISLYEQSDQEACAKLAKRGVTFSFVELKKGEWVPLAKAPLGAGGIVESRPKKTTETKQKAEAPSPKASGGKAKAKPKKVKPAYKRKARTAQEKRNKQSRRSSARKGK